MDILTVTSGPLYDQQSTVINQNVTWLPPAAVALPTSTRQLQQTLLLLRSHEIGFSLRSGGHNYEGYSVLGPVVISQVLRKGIVVDERRNVVEIESGVTAGELTKELARYGLALPTGTCRTVGIAGLSLGGGIGFMSRKYGLTLDNLLQLEVVLASGEIVKCNAHGEHSDLFWACRGAGGGNFCIVSRFWFRVFPVRTVLLFEMHWALEHVSTVLDAWQRFAPFAPDDLTAELNLSHAGAEFTGQWEGEQEKLLLLLQSFTRSLPPPLATPVPRIWSTSYEGAVEHFDAAGSTAPRKPIAFKNKSSFAFELLPPLALLTVQRWMENAPPSGKLELDPFGGAVNRVPRTATAFPHRGSTLYWLQFASSWQAGDKEQERVNRGWVEGFYAAMRGFLRGAYVNCPDNQLENYLEEYFEENLPRLRQVKQRYDPDNVFHFPQGL